MVVSCSKPLSNWLTSPCALCPWLFAATSRTKFENSLSIPVGSSASYHANRCGSDHRAFLALCCLSLRLKVLTAQILSYPDQLNPVFQVFHSKRCFHSELGFACLSWPWWCVMFLRNGCGFAHFRDNFLLLMQLRIGARKGSWFVFDYEKNS